MDSTQIASLTSDCFSFSDASIRYIFFVMKFCIACSSVASDIILSVLSINSEVPVKLKLELTEPLDWSVVKLYCESLLSITRFLFLCRPRDATVTGLGQGIVITPLFCIHFVWYNCLQSMHRCP